MGYFCLVFYTIVYYFIRIALESVLDVYDPGPSTLRENADGVEANGMEIGGVVEEVFFRDLAYGPLFAGGDSFERFAEARAAAEFDLDDDEGSVFAGYKVQLAVTGPVVLVHDGVAAVFEKAAGEPLAELPARAVVQPATPA